MAKKNLDHLFLDDGRRVTMDKRDGSVILSNDHDGCYYDGVIFNGQRIGYMEPHGQGGWTAKALDGATRFVSTKREVIAWLMRSMPDTSPVRMPTIHEAFESLPAQVRGILEGDLTSQAMYVAMTFQAPPGYWEPPDPDHAVSELETISRFGRPR